MSSPGEVFFIALNLEACSVCQAGKTVCNQFGSIEGGRVATVVGTREARFCDEAVVVLNERRKELGLKLIGEV